jgi:uncharacterized protein
MVILHGAGSAKENHADFGRACAGAGWAAISYDQRGHGRSTEPMSPAALDDVNSIADLLAAREGVDPARICVRGSSMGGFLAIEAAAAFERIAGAIAICPAEPDGLRRGLRAGELEMNADVGALERWLEGRDLAEAAELMGPKPLILLHAEGDERVPYTSSVAIHRRAREPRKLILMPGGHHRSIQHDPELQGVALRWLERNLPPGWCGAERPPTGGSGGRTRRSGRR